MSLPRFTDLGTLPGYQWSEAIAITGSGWGIGNSWRRTASSPMQIAPGAFVWKDGVMTALGTLGGKHGRADAANPAGDRIVGKSYTGKLHDGYGLFHAALWTLQPSS